MNEWDVRTDRVSKQEDKLEDITQSAAQRENKDCTKEQRKQDSSTHPVESRKERTFKNPEGIDLERQPLKHFSELMKDIYA